MKIMQTSSWKQAQNITSCPDLSSPRNIKDKMSPAFARERLLRETLIRFTTKTIDQLFQLLLVTPMGRTGAASLDVSPFCKGLWSYHRRICILKPITGFQLTVDLSTTHRSQFLINSRHFRFSPTSYICLAAVHVQLISKQTAISWFCHPFVMRRC